MSWAAPAAQRAVQIIDPAVKRANDCGFAGAFFVSHNARPAVTTQVMKGPHNIVFAAHDQRSLTHDIGCEVITCAGNIVHMTNHLPMAAKQLLLFGLQKLRIEKAPRR